MSNLTKFGFLRPEANGSFTLTLPAPDDCPLPNYAVEQTGGWVAAIVKDPKAYVGARVDACSEVLTVGGWATLLSTISGKEIKTLGIPGGDAYLDGTEVKKTVAEEIYLNYRGFYRGCVSATCHQGVAADRSYLLACCRAMSSRARRSSPSSGIRVLGLSRTRRSRLCLVSES
jgi:hypothetical protein